MTHTGKRGSRQSEVLSRSAGVVIVRKINDRWRFLVLRAYAHWDFPKGLAESGEDLLDTAVRETREESGITDLEFAWGTLSRETGPYGRGKVARYYIALTRTDRITLPVSPELGRPEHHEYRWVEYDEARTLLPARLLPILAWAHAVISSAP